MAQKKNPKCKSGSEALLVVSGYVSVYFCAEHGSVQCDPGWIHCWMLSGCCVPLSLLTSALCQWKASQQHFY